MVCFVAPALFGTAREYNSPAILLKCTYMGEIGPASRGCPGIFPLNRTNAGFAAFISLTRLFGFLLSDVCSQVLTYAKKGRQKWSAFREGSTRPR